MRKGVVFFLVLLLLGIFFVPPASLFAQMILKKPLPLTQQNQATIASILPNTVILQQGGPAAIVTVDGKFLETVLAVKAIRNGQGVGEIAVKLVQPWPASRKDRASGNSDRPCRQGLSITVHWEGRADGVQGRRTSVGIQLRSGREENAADPTNDLVVAAIDTQNAYCDNEDPPDFS